MTRSRRGRGEGSISQRIDGRWIASASSGYDAKTGRRIRRTVSGKTKAEVQAKLDHLRKLQPTVRQRGTVAEFLGVWLETLAAQKSVAPSTLDRYQTCIRCHVAPVMGKRELGRLRTHDIQTGLNVLAGRGVSIRNRTMIVSVLHRAMDAAVAQGYLAANPVQKLTVPRYERQDPEPLAPELLVGLLEAAAANRFSALIVLALATGARQGELFALDWADIDFETGTLSISKSLEEVRGNLRIKSPKTKSGYRRVTLPVFAVDALHEHRKRMLAEGNGGAPIFCDTNGGWLRKSNFYRRTWQPLTFQAKLDGLRFHDLRHQHASHLMLQGVSAKVVSQRLGHKDVSVTLKVYSHVLPQLDAEAAAAIEGLYSKNGSAGAAKLADHA